MSISIETVAAACRLEPSLEDAGPGDKFQFERNGYFYADPEGVKGAPVFNRTVTLRDAWAKIERGVKGNKSS